MLLFTLLLLLMSRCASAMTTQEARDELRLPREYDKQALKSAYRKRSVETHPDKGGSTEEFLRCSEAYDKLSGGGSKSHRGGGGSSPFEGGTPQDQMKYAEMMFDTMMDEVGERA